MSTMYKIFVGNVNYTTTEEQIRGIVPPEIVIEEIVIARDDEGKSKGYAFVLTRDKEAARKAIARAGKPEIDGRRVYFRESHGKTSPPPDAKRRPQQRRRPGPGGPGGRRRPFRPRARRDQTTGYEGADGTVSNKN